MGLNFLVVIVLLLGVMWVLIIRPQKRRQLQQADLIARVAGDEILTAGGIYGIVRELDEDSVMLEIAPGTTIRVARRAIAGKVEPDEPDEELEEAAEEPHDETADAAEESASVEPNRR